MPGSCLTCSSLFSALHLSPAFEIARIRALIRHWKRRVPTALGDSLNSQNLWVNRGALPLVPPLDVSLQVCCGMLRYAAVCYCTCHKQCSYLKSVRTWIKVTAESLALNGKEPGSERWTGTSFAPGWHSVLVWISIFRVGSASTRPFALKSGILSISLQFVRAALGESLFHFTMYFSAGGGFRERSNNPHVGPESSWANGCYCHLES